MKLHVNIEPTAGLSTKSPAAKTIDTARYEGGSWRNPKQGNKEIKNEQQVS